VTAPDYPTIPRNLLGFFDFVFAFGLHYLIDQPIQNRIRAWLKARGKGAAVSQPVVSLEG